MKKPSKMSFGVTLVEILIAMAIFITLLTLSALLLSSAWRKFHATNALQDAKTNAFLAMDRLSQDLKETSVVHLKNNASRATSIEERYICFPSPRDMKGTFKTLSTGDPDWNTWVIYSLAPDREYRELYHLYRKRISGPSNVPPALSDIENHNDAQTAARFILNFEMDEDEDFCSFYSYNALIVTQKPYRNEKFNFKLDKNFSFKLL
ncbi:MAG: PilW family protein [Vulcanimicrobiota bacterium]